MQFTFKEVVQAVITLVILSVFVYGIVTGITMTETFINLMLVVVGFWFGLSQLTEIVSSAVQRKKDNNYPNMFKG